MKVSLICAVAENGVIGSEGDLPWRIRDDMRFFVRTTKGRTVIMGRLNYDSMGQPLKNRTNIVVSRDPGLVIEGCTTVTSVEAALTRAEDTGEDEAFIIGGAQIYALGAPYAHKFYRTRVLADVPGDVFFPKISFSDWDCEVVEKKNADKDNEHPYVIEVLTRRDKAKEFR
jgi:dihydrofolate reductase